MRTLLKIICMVYISIFSNHVFAMNAVEGADLAHPLFPSDNWWNLDIRTWPVDPNSASFISFINNGSTRRLHPDFGGNSGVGNGIYGIPYAVISGATANDLQAVTFQYSDESDGVDLATGQGIPFYPIPPEAITQPHWIEGGDPGNIDLRSSYDRHLLIVDKDKNYLYELYNVFYDASLGKWQAGSGAFFNMNTNNRRPDGWTSADAAGLAILPGLVRYDEAYNAAVPEINHAFRVTVRATNGYVYPASHKAGSGSGALPMGARLRLKSSVDVTQRTSDPNAQKIFRAMQKYGLIVADNGSDMFITGTYDVRWNNDILNPAFSSLTANDFEVIQLGYNPPPATYPLTVNKAGTCNTALVTSNPAGINCGADCNESYAPNSSVTLKAGAVSGCTFAGWSGDCSGTASTCAVTMSAAKTVTATYNKINKTLIVVKAGTGSGTVTSTPAGINCGSDCNEDYAPNTKVTLKAAVVSGSLFSGWNGGGCSGTAASCTITITANTTVTATFSKPIPDFVVTAMTLTPPVPTARATFSVAVTVKNQGTLAGNAGYLEVWENQPTAQTCGAEGNAWVNVGTLAVGQSKTITLSNLRSGAAGNKTARAFINSWCETAESNSTNNQLTKPYTVTSLPLAPVLKTAVPSTGQVVLTWGVGAGATSYDVYQGTTAGGEGTTPVKTGITGTTATLTGLTNGTTYFFKVGARNAYGTSSLSNELSTSVVNPSTNYLVAYNSGPSGTLGLVNNWIQEFWGNVPTNMAVPAPGRSGSQALEVIFGAANGWNGVGFAHRIDWNNIYPLFLNQFRTVEFDIYFAADSVGEDNLNFILEDAGHADTPSITSLIPGWSGMSAGQKHGNWFHIVVDLTKIHPKVSQYPLFSRWLLFNNAEGSVSKPHYYLSNVQLGWFNDTTSPVLTFGSASLNLTYDKLALTWTTDEPTIQKVDFGTTSSYGKTLVGGITDWDYTLSHTANLTGLTPGTTVYYKITASDHQYLPGVVANTSTYTGSYVLPSIPNAVPVISNLAVSKFDSVTATLTWATDRPCTETITYKKTGGATLTRNLSDFSASRTFMLDLLEPSTSYAVSIVATDAFNKTSVPATINVTTSVNSTADVTVTIDPNTKRSISPWIYGLNFYGQINNAPAHLTLDRAGGNRWTAYNWENNASNAGNDWNYSSDDYLGGGNTPAEAIRTLIAANQSLNMASLMTVQLQGYVAADKAGPVDINDPNHFANRFKQVMYKKGSAFTPTPSTTDAFVYMDEFLSVLRGKFTEDIFSSTTTPTFISLDNEPELWGDTHKEIQTGVIDAEAYIQKTIQLSKAIKDIAPNAQIFGPAHYGFNGIVNWQNTMGDATGTYWFTDKYLQELKVASTAYGKRLVDVYDLHWYPEATGDGARIVGLDGSTLTDNQVQAIVQSPRSLWDSTYTETSWISNWFGGPINLLGRIQSKIDADWPGTKIAITEYLNGGQNHIAGTLAQADNLGIFGNQGVFAATLWPQGNGCPFIYGGFRMFRGFDGANANFGDISLKATSSNIQNVSAYISLDSQISGRVVITAINRSKTFQEVSFNGQLLKGTAYVYRITDTTAQVQKTDSQPIAPVFVGQVPVNTSSWVMLLPPLSVSTVEVR
ncbi:exported hypothetical protein [Gammaproteobacteria bacterium]